MDTEQTLISLEKFKEITPSVLALVDKMEWTEMDSAPPRDGVVWHEFETPGIILRFQPERPITEVIAIEIGFRIARKLASSPIARLLGQRANVEKAKANFHHAFEILSQCGLCSSDPIKVATALSVKNLAVAEHPDGTTKTIGLLSLDQQIWLEWSLGPDGWEQLEFIDLQGFKDVYTQQNSVAPPISTLTDAAGHFMGGSLGVSILAI